LPEREAFGATTEELGKIKIGRRTAGVLRSALLSDAVVAIKAQHVSSHVHFLAVCRVPDMSNRLSKRVSTRKLQPDFLLQQCYQECVEPESAAQDSQGWSEDDVEGADLT